MLEISVEVEGMMCGMCEAHINDAVRRAFPVKKVSSSRAKGLTVLRTEEDIDPERLKAVIDATGYRSGAVTKREVKKNRFGF